MLCHNCGKEIPDDSRFCSICGAAVTSIRSLEEQQCDETETIQEAEGKGETSVDQEEVVKKKRGKKKLWIIVAISVLLVIAAALCAVVLLSRDGLKGAKSPEEALEQYLDAVANGDWYAIREIEGMHADEAIMALWKSLIGSGSYSSEEAVIQHLTRYWLSESYEYDLEMREWIQNRIDRIQTLRDLAEFENEIDGVILKRELSEAYGESCSIRTYDLRQKVVAEKDWEDLMNEEFRLYYSDHYAETQFAEFSEYGLEDIESVVYLEYTAIMSGTWNYGALSSSAYAVKTKDGWFLRYPTAPYAHIDNATYDAY